MSINVEGTPPPVNVDAQPSPATLGFSVATHSVSASSFIDTNVEATLPSLSLTPINGSANNNVNVSNTLPSLVFTGANHTIVGQPETQETPVNASAPTLTITGANADVFATAGVSEFPLFDVYSDIVNFRGGTPIPASNTRYWDKPTYPTTGTIYASEAAINSAIASASPGDTLRLANGSYSAMNINVGVSGNSSNPITVAAESKLGVSLTGQSDFDVTGSFINIMGFAVTGTNASGTEVFHDTGDDNLYAFNDITALRTGGSNKCYWFRIFGDRTRCCYNTCDDKLSGRSPFRTGQNKYVRIDHNEGIDILGDAVDGDFEFIQFDESGETRDNFCLADNNYILRYNNLGGNRYFSGEREIISNKSSSNIFIQNVLVDCAGHLFDRTAHRSTYYANWIDGGNVEASGGISLSGDDSYAFCNYIVNTGLNSAHTLSMREGGGNHEASVNNQTAFNLIKNCETSMTFSVQGSTGGTNASGIQVYNTAIDYAAGESASVTNDTYSGAGTWGGNVFKSPDGVAESTTNAEILAATPQLTLDNGYYVPTAGGNCRGTGSTAHHALCTVDILGNAIPGSNPNVSPFQDGWDLTGDPRQVIIDEAGA